MKLWAWLRSWVYCPLDWMDLHGPENCWTCFFRYRRLMKKQKWRVANAPRIPQARALNGRKT